VEQTFDILTQKVLHPKANPNITFPHSQFCSFLVRFDAYNLVSMFNSTSYDEDVITRHMFFRQLSEYKPCTRITDCGGNPYNPIFNRALGSEIPIYFGAQDVGSFINPQSFVHCNVSRSVIEEILLLPDETKTIFV
jgi:hypothetical protein